MDEHRVARREVGFGRIKIRVKGGSSREEAGHFNQQLWRKRIEDVVAIVGYRDEREGRMRETRGKGKRCANGGRSVCELSSTT